MSTRGLPGCVSNGYLARHHQTLGVLAAKSCSGWPHRDSEAKLERDVRRAGWFDRLVVRPKSAKRIPMIHLVRLRSSQRVNVSQIKRSPLSKYGYTERILARCGTVIKIDEVIMDDPDLLANMNVFSTRSSKQVLSRNSLRLTSEQRNVISESWCIAIFGRESEELLIYGNFSSSRTLSSRLRHEDNALTDCLLALRHPLRPGSFWSSAHFPRTSAGAKPIRSSLIRNTSIRHLAAPQRADPALHRTSDCRS